MKTFLLGFVAILVSVHESYGATKGGVLPGQAQIALDDVGRPYSFNYEQPAPYVKKVEETDPLTGRVRGSYTVADPARGRAKTVNYAKDEAGFRAAVQTTDPLGPSAAKIVSVPGKGTVAALQDPVSQAAQEALLDGGLGGSGLGGPGNIQFTLGDPLAAKGFVSRNRNPLYNIGMSRVPYGLSGLDYYSYPRNLYSPRGVKTVVSKGGLGGYGSPAIQYTLGDPLTGRSYIVRNPFYRTGYSSVPYGLSGLDYYSYPNNLYSPAGLKTVITKANAGNGLSGLGGIGSLAGRKGFGGPGAIQYTLGDPRSLYRAGQSNIPFGLSGLDYYSYPSYLTSPRRVKTVVTKANAGGLGGLGGIGSLAGANGGLGGLSGAGPNIQFTLGDPSLGGVGGRKGATVYDPLTRRLYRVGPSRMPFGLSGLDYSSYPRDLSYLRPLLATKGGLAGKGFAGGDIQRGLGDVGFGSQAPQVVDYAISDPFSGGLKRVRKIVYRNGQSAIPYGLSGFDYSSYPNNLLNQLNRAKGLAKASGGVRSPFARPDVIQEEAIVDPITGDVLGKKVTKTVSDPLSGPGSIQFTLGDQQSKIGSGLGPVYAIRRSQVPFGLTGQDYYSYPARLYRQRAANAALQQKLADAALSGIADPLEQRRVIGAGAAPGNIHFTLGVASGIAGGLRRVNLYDPSSLSRPVQQTIVTSPSLGGGVPNIQFRLGDSSLGGLGAAQPVVKTTTVTKPDPILAAAGLVDPAPVVVTTVSKPSTAGLASPAFGQRRIASGLGDPALDGTGLGGSQVAYIDPATDSLTAQSPIADALAGQSPISDALTDPRVQEALADSDVLGSPLGAGAGGVDPTSQFSLDDPSSLGSGLGGGDILRTVEQIPGAGPGGSTVTRVTEQVQEKVGAGDFGASRPRIITYSPRMSYMMSPRYDIPYSSLGGRGTYGLRTSGLRSPLAQQQVEQVLVKK